MKTILQFDLFRDGEDSFFTDPTCVFINGYFNWIMVDDFLTNIDYLRYIDESLEVGQCSNVTVEIWEDCDDYRSWLDYRVVNMDEIV